MLRIENVVLDRGTRATRICTLVETDADGEIFALCIESGTYFGFNDSASDLWRLLETPQTLDMLVQELTARFAVADDECVRDVSATLAWLEKVGLVTLDRADDMGL
jgi:hypothetical protein